MGSTLEAVDSEGHWQSLRHMLGNREYNFFPLDYGLKSKQDPKLHVFVVAWNTTPPTNTLVSPFTLIQ